MSARAAAVVLGTGAFRTVVLPSGGGVSLWHDVALTRWRADPTLEPDGCALYLRDDAGHVWSAGRYPAAAAPDAWYFEPGDAGVRFARTDGDVTTTTTVTVAPDADVEMRRYEIRNTGGRARAIELTSFVELALARPAGDLAHPAFGKLFVQTAWDSDAQALLAWRRGRSADEAPLWAAHALVTTGDGSEAEFETDRARFIGRGRDVRAPLALTAPARLGTTLGSVLDPVFAMRRRVVVPAGGSVTAVALLAAGRGRPGVLAALRSAAATAVHGAVPAPAASAAVAAAALTAVPWLDMRERLAGAGAPRATAYEPAAAAPGRAPDAERLREFNGSGGFTQDGTEYVIRLERTAGGLVLPPLPWVNVIASPHAGCIVSERGAATTWVGNSRENRLTPWWNDPVSDPTGEALWLRDEDRGIYWSPLPGPTPGSGAYEVRHGFGYTTCRHHGQELRQEATCFVAADDPVRLTLLTIANTGAAPRRLSLFAYAEWVLGGSRPDTMGRIASELDQQTGAILARRSGEDAFAGHVAFAALSGGTAAAGTADRGEFVGAAGTLERPAGVAGAEPLSGWTGAGRDPCAALRCDVALAPGAEATFVFALGQAKDAASARALLAGYRDAGRARLALDRVRARWCTTLRAVRIETPEPALDLMVNGWAAYQTLSCRLWGRSALYQSGGAFGYRDQLQDAAALVYHDPRLLRDQIVLHAGHQFAEGDVLHWWHPPDDRGLRTHFSDDLLWLPWAVLGYLDATGDHPVLEETAPFVDAPWLPEGEDERFLKPSVRGAASVYEHCCLALDRSLPAGAHGLPLMGSGDWNDGMNRVGRLGRGESVWLGFFLYDLLGRFAPLAEARGDHERAGRYRARHTELGKALNDAGWDGGWYRRAFDDDGRVLGSAENEECRIDAIAQAWAVLSGAAPEDRAAQALDALERHLVRERDGLIMLLAPPFDRTPLDPGYIKGYVPGVRENGGQYTHGALWAVRALAEAGRGERAAPLLTMLTPVAPTRTPEGVARYQAEPFVTAADVYAVPPHTGRAGWTWYTGSAGWLLRVALESVLGFTVERGRTVVLRPCLPAAWPGFTIRYRGLEIRVLRAAGQPTRVSGSGVTVADGAVRIALDDGPGDRVVEIGLGADLGPRYRPR